MAAVAHVFPNAVKNIASKVENWATGSTELKVGLASGTFNWPGTGNSTAGYLTVADFLANAGSGGGGALTEVSASGYVRTALSGVSLTTSGLVVTLTCSNVSWTAGANWSAQYAFFYDTTVDTNDTTRQLVCYWDFGGTVSVVTGGNFTLTINASGLVTFTSS
jgi:hypothetical protein